jgi:hypothetical protein
MVVGEKMSNHSDKYKIKEPRLEVLRYKVRSGGCSLKELNEYNSLVPEVERVAPKIFKRSR